MILSPRNGIVSGAVLGLLVVSGLVFTDTDSGDVVARSTTTVTTTTIAPPTTSNNAPSAALSEAQRQVDEIVTFVEVTRGLKFKEKPAVTLLADAEFVDKLREAGRDEKPTAQEEQTLEDVTRALRIVSSSQSAREAIDSLLDESVVGFYSPKAKRLYVRGVSLSPYVRAIVAHELTHALQDQHFGIDRNLEDRIDEADTGFTALIEGDAVRVQYDYQSALKGADKTAYFAEQNRLIGGGSSAPLGLQQLLGFPYQAGPVFVQRLFEEDGNRAVDAAFVKPPTSSEQVLHPDKFRAGELGVPVNDVTAPTSADERGVFGEALIRIVLQQTLPLLTANNAAEGWGGDRYAVYRLNNKSCISVDFVMDTDKDARELVAAFTSWSQAGPGAVVQSQPDRRMRLDSCV